nr:MAG TPA: hypothetical protein [Bacteriophage sp.]
MNIYSVYAMYNIFFRCFFIYITILEVRRW